MKTKYAIGQEVWTMHENKPINMLVYECIIKQTCKKWCGKVNYKLLNIGDANIEISYGLICSSPNMPQIVISENKCFTSKEELLKSL